MQRRILALTSLALLGSVAAAQPTTDARGWHVSGIPALNYNADDGFGYGVVLNVYDYGTRGTLPYVVAIEPRVFLTTGGRRDYTLFVDAPNIGGSKWRVDSYVASETRRAQPYFGIGNETPRDKSLEEEPNEKYYKFGQERAQFTLNVQRRLGSRVRALAGVGAARVRVTPIPDGTTTTLLSEHLAGSTPPEGWASSARLGLVWDSRDREVHTRSGTWADALVQRVNGSSGDYAYTRSTLTVRQYVPVTAKLTAAARVIVQNVNGDAPFYDLTIVQTSFKSQEGLGGSSTLRGVPLNRFIGKGMALANSELRWRVAEPTIFRSRGSVTLSAFVDAGRVWDDKVDLGSVTSDLHAGYGGGVRVGLGPNFVVAFDAGHSNEATLPIYIGLGFLFRTREVVGE